MSILDDSDGPSERLTDHFSGRPGVEYKKAFARNALTINGKIFVVFRLGELVLKLPPDVGPALLESGEARQFEPAPGRFMKEWFALGAEIDEDRWTELAEVAFDYVVSLQG